MAADTADIRRAVIQACSANFKFLFISGPSNPNLFYSPRRTGSSSDNDSNRPTTQFCTDTRIVKGGEGQGEKEKPEDRRNPKPGGKQPTTRVSERFWTAPACGDFLGASTLLSGFELEPEAAALADFGIEAN